jgi:hypothetical protein
MVPAKPGGPGMGAGEVFFEVAEKRQLPAFSFFGGGGIDVWRSQECEVCRRITKNTRFGGRTVGDL